VYTIWQGYPIWLLENYGGNLCTALNCFGYLGLVNFSSGMNLIVYWIKMMFLKKKKNSPSFEFYESTSYVIYFFGENVLLNEKKIKII
jgi:hypothetical protein